jgi:nucleoside-diphosphate-sugar epimerase
MWLMLQRETPSDYIDGSPTREFVHVEDPAKGIGLAGKNTMEIKK